MNTTKLNKIDKLIIVIIASFFLNLFVLWIIANIFRTNNFLIWISSTFISMFLSYKIVDPLNNSSEETREKKYLSAFILFVLLLILSFLIMIEPILKYPYQTIGIPNKDLHDGMAKYISIYGYSPNDNVDDKNLFIVNSNNGLYLGYPNLLHVTSAYLIKLGIFEFHATWIAVIGGILISSLALFLILKLLYPDPYIAAITAGLFPISSEKIFLGVATSVPMIFTYTLIIPSLLLFIIYIEYFKKGYSIAWEILIAIAFACVASAYSGVIFIIIIFASIYILICYFMHKKIQVTRGLRVFIILIPILIGVFAFQKEIYWKNTFATATDYDPTELSQRFIPLEKPFYMFVYFISLTALVYKSSIKKIFKFENLTLATFFLLINLFLISFVGFDILFHIINRVNTLEDLIDLKSAQTVGIFSPINHQRLSRLAFLQPFFFIIFFPSFILMIKNQIKYVLLIIAILCSFILNINIPLYHWPDIEIEVFYNQEKTLITLPSNLRLFINPKIWNREILQALDYLKKQPELDNDKVFLLDERIWTEETIQGWGSSYLTYRILSKKNLNISPTKELSNKELEELVHTLRKKQIYYLLFIAKEDKTPPAISTIIWQKGNVSIFQL